MVTQVENSGGKQEAEHLGPCQAIKKFCLECAGTYKDVRGCLKETCFLFHFRLGKNPWRQGVGGAPYHKLAWYFTAMSIYILHCIEQGWL
jgi:hypothetical protein